MKQKNIAAGTDAGNQPSSNKINSDYLSAKSVSNEREFTLAER